MNQPVSLRPHQVIAADDIDRLFAKKFNYVMSVQPTGSGKTIIKAHFAKKAYDNGETCVLIAHRDVLLGQISNALCLFKIPHTFICADDTRRDITNLNYKEHGDHYYNEKSRIVIVSVATFAARLKKERIPKAFCESVNWWLMDECHHLTQGSQWGTCIESFPNARGLGVTATPLRGDRKGLGKHAHGYFETLSCTSSMIELVKEGRLTQMKVYAPTHLDVGDLKITAGGDYNQKGLYKETKKQGGQITGSAVEHYNKYIYGQPAITFAVNIEHGKYIAKKFNEAGIPTAFVSSKSSESDRKQAVSDLRSGKLWNLVNVDLFGEGFDAPAVAAVFLLRKTASYSLFKQQIGRCLRPFEGKDFGYVFDHVGNVSSMLEKYSLSSPYHDPEWTLDSYGKGKNSDGGDEIPKSMECPECSYEAPLFDVFDDDGDLILEGFTQPDGSYKCPDDDCGHTFDDEESEVVVRKIQEQKGELVELKFDEVDELISKRDDEIMKDVSEMNSCGRYAAANMSRHVDRQNAIVILQRKINTWCNNVFKETGWSSELVRREFEVKFKINIFKAQILPSSKAMELSKNVQRDTLQRNSKTRTV